MAVDILDQENDIWVWDLTAESLRRLTFDAGLDVFGEWTPDSQRVIFSSPRGGRPALFWRAADGTGTTEPLGQGEGGRFPQAVTPDGRVVVVLELSPNADLITVALSGEPVSEDLLVTGFDERGAALSPDGRWFAYQSDASGEMEVYVRPFSNADSELHPISTNGGTSPLWAPDGSELFYVDDDRLLAVPVRTDPTFSRGTATVEIEGDYPLSTEANGVVIRHYDIDPSGDRFILLKPTSATDSDGGGLRSLTFVLNWHEELKRLVPIP